MALLHYTAKFDPFLSLDCARVEGGAKDQILPYGNLASKDNPDGSTAKTRARHTRSHSTPNMPALEEALSASSQNGGDEEKVKGFQSLGPLLTLRPKRFFYFFPNLLFVRNTDLAIYSILFLRKIGICTLLP